MAPRTLFAAAFAALILGCASRPASWQGPYTLPVRDGEGANPSSCVPLGSVEGQSAHWNDAYVARRAAVDDLRAAAAAIGANYVRFESYRLSGGRTNRGAAAFGVALRCRAPVEEPVHLRCDRESGLSTCGW